MRTLIRRIWAWKFLFITIIVLGVLLIVSFYVSSLNLEPKTENLVIFDNNGKALAKAPFPPSSEFLLGTDRSGYKVDHMLLIGAKFTILAGLGITLLRVTIGSVIGLFLSMYARKVRFVVEAFSLPFKYIPALIVAMFLMNPVVRSYISVDLLKLVSVQIIILVVIALPSVITWSSDLVDKLRETSYVQSSLLLGASPWHIIRKHLLPHLKVYGGILFLQQFIQTLTLMMYLGVFGYFIGGSVFASVIKDENVDKGSLVNEWAGLIGFYRKEYLMAPWLVLFPMLCFFLLIMLASLTVKEWEKNTVLGVKLPLKEKEKINSDKKKSVSFTFVNKEIGREI
ncbi:ABC transporter permease subunit [Peribacillus acanthi]|uniref:ABC transporter permease subunit n=1 Tax=Peribacillus acanthi TaxID=2171554 RepID=UPI000D3E8277|nr:ABC transporter permease subunit [Peribacillus acanthi]